MLFTCPIQYYRKETRKLELSIYKESKIRLDLKDLASNPLN